MASGRKTTSTTRDLSWAHGLVVVSFSWFMAMMLGAIPHWLSGHFGSFLDACFDLDKYGRAAGPVMRRAGV